MIDVGDSLDGEGIRQAFGAPHPALTAYRGVVVEVVEKDEALRQGVLIRGDFLAIQGQRRVPVALGQIAKDLIVAAVLLDHVDHVFDLARFDAKAGHGAIGRASHGGSVLVVPYHLRRGAGEVWQGFGQIDPRDVPRNGIQNVSRARGSHPCWGVRGGVDPQHVRVEIVEAGIGIHRFGSPAVDDQQRIALRCGSDGRRIPSYRDVAAQLIGPRVDDAHSIEIAEGRVQGLLVGRQREARRRHAGQIDDVRRAQQDRCLHPDLIRGDVGDRHGVAFGVGHVQERLRLVEKKCRRLA